MRNGFTTGSCAAAAGKAAAYMLLSGIRKERIRIDTPAGIPYETMAEEIRMGEDSVCCAVRKDAGDDPDVTNGTLIAAEVIRIRDGLQEVRIEGGEGVGIVTRPGLDRKVGESAINTVPRQMIKKEVTEVMQLFDCSDSLRIVISVPEGRKLAEKTFNPRLGIAGGISIIGTSGIVEPMSKAALIGTIRLEVRQRKAEGYEILVVSPGNYGLSFIKEHYGYDLDKAVKCSNYIGETIDMAKEAGFRKLLLIGHVGKLIKLSGGIMNTHSREADARMELLAAAAIRCGASHKTLQAVLDSTGTEEACGYLYEEGIAERCFTYLMGRISFYLQKRAGEDMEIECILFSNERGLLGKTEAAEKRMQEAMTGQGHKDEEDV